MKEDIGTDDNNIENNNTYTLTIDELAQATNVPTRTIRYYTHEGLLPSPVLKGRLGLYSEEHIKKLELIKKLQKETYLPLSIIREIVTEPKRAELLDRNIQLKEEVFSAFGYEPNSFRYDSKELAAFTNLSSQQIKKLEEMGLIVPQRIKGKKRYDHHDLEIAKRAKIFVSAGFSIDCLNSFGLVLEELTQKEMSLFYDKFAPQIESSPQEVIEAARGIVDAANHLIFNLHAKIIQKKIEKEIFSYTQPNTSKDKKRGEKEKK